MAESRERDSWGGKVTDHFNDAGDKIGESREVEGVTGKRTDYYDTNHNKIGESREVDGVTGKRTEYRNTNYEKIGESREVDGVTGKRTEYRDTYYNKTGESRRWLGLRGPYTKHEGAGWFPGAQRKEKDGVLGGAGGEFSGSGSSFRWVGSSAGIIAVLFVIGLLLLAWGLGSITSTNTRASNPPPRGTLAPAPRVTLAPTPPATVRVPSSPSARVKDDAGLLTPAQESAKSPPAERPENNSNVPSTMSGIWRGSVSQPGFPAYPIELNIQPGTEHKVEYPTLACGGTLSQSSVRDDVMQFRERIEHNSQRKCVDSGIVRLVLRAEGQLRYEWYYPNSQFPGSQPGATALLIRATGP